MRDPNEDNFTGTGAHQVDINPYATPQYVEQAADGGASGAASLRTTAIGLNLIYYGIVLMLLGAMVAAFGMILLRQLRLPGASIPAVLIVALALIGIAVALNLVGVLTCLAVPKESGGKMPVVYSVLFQAMSIASGVAIVLFQLEIPEDHFLLPQAAANALGAISFLCFLVFLKRLAAFVQRRDLVRRATSVLQCWIICIVLLVVASVFMATIGDGIELGMIGLVIMIPALILGIIIFVMYANLINALRKVLAQPPAQAR